MRAEAMDAIEDWKRMRIRVAGTLRQPGADSTWLERFAAVTHRVRDMAAHEPDVALYLLVQTATHEPENYSANHSLLCAVVCDLCAGVLQWEAEETTSLVHAALSMNVAMMQEQDILAAQIGPPTAAQRACVDIHAVQGATTLHGAGVQDALWLQVVAAHHEDPLPGEPLANLSQVQRLTRVLRSVDVFTAKISRRKAREAMSPTRAARELYLGAEGQPDEVGAALLRTLGLYPPGSYVRLANEEVAVVLTRGKRANAPVAVSILRAGGRRLDMPEPRDTADARYAVKATIQADDRRLQLDHRQILACA